MNIKPATYLSKTDDNHWQPQRILLFSGHMIDAPDRTRPRFPASKEAIALQAIDETLDQLKVGSQDLALTQGASGGDILFVEACLKRGVNVQFLQPFDEKTFIEKSVAVSGDQWLERYAAIVENVENPPLAAPMELGELPPNTDPYERCNLWLLNSSLAYGADKLTFICLWDGGGGDGPGGTADMVAKVKNQKGNVIWLDTKILW